MTVDSKKELVVIDGTEVCPYLPSQQARMPLRIVLQTMTPELVDHYLSAGFRRSGEFIYQTECPACNACEAIRLIPSEFRFTSGFRRTLNRGKRRYREVAGPMSADFQRINLFNRHRQFRGLAAGESAIDLDDYHWGFVRSCFDSFEIAWYDHEDRLVCLSVIDRGARSWSAVYTYYDPEIRGDSLGTFAVLRQVELCLEAGIDWLYLGYYVADCDAMNYKIRFQPHERLLDGKWVRTGSTV